MTEKEKLRKRIKMVKRRKVELRMIGKKGEKENKEKERKYKERRKREEKIARKNVK